MLKLNLTMTQKFVAEVTPTHMTIETILGFSAIASFVAIAISHDSNFSFDALFPFMITSIILYIVTLRTKTHHIKRLHLLSGLSGLLMSLTCMCACLVIVPLRWPETFKWFLIVLVADIAGIGYVFFRTMRLVYARSNVVPIVGTIGIGAISCGIALGKVFSKRIDADFHTVAMVCFAIFSWVFSFFFVGIMRYHYIKKLEKLK